MALSVRPRVSHNPHSLSRRSLPAPWLSMPSTWTSYNEINLAEFESEAGTKTQNSLLSLTALNSKFTPPGMWAYVEQPSHWAATLNPRQFRHSRPRNRGSARDLAFSVTRLNISLGRSSLYRRGHRRLVWRKVIGTTVSNGRTVWPRYNYATFTVLVSELKYLIPHLVPALQALPFQFRLLKRENSHNISTENTGYTTWISLITASTVNGIKLQAWNCVDGNKNQLFKFYPGGNFQIEWNGMGKCHDLMNGNYTSGNPIKRWDCIVPDDNSNQDCFSVPGNE
ncbi:hypothetical protein C8R45DRAFT_936316 [Mycena sanguinolenta]|nr:hypothetical protein C8R45DRAFT_936316 [Mycena sanguinolenta]